MDEREGILLTVSNFQLRQATLILPKTGRRVKRNVTFGPPPAIDGAHDAQTTDDRTPLVGRKRLGFQPTTVSLLMGTAQQYAQQAHNCWAV